MILRTVGRRTQAPRARRRRRRSASLAPAVLGVILAPALAAVLALAPAVVAADRPADRPPRVPLAEVQAGQTGYGLTVFRGDRPDTFAMTVLGVQRGARAGGDVILVRLSGQGLERTAVARGMSGSPIYLDDGRLLGAVAFGWPGALEPIAGLTPAYELDLVRDRPVDRLGADGPAPAPPTDLFASLAGPAPGAFAAAMLPDLAARAPVASPPRRAAAERPWPTPEELALRLLPRAAPRPSVTAGGLPVEPLELGLFAQPARAGLAAATAATAATGEAAPALAAGSACAISLVAGDGQLGALGTVSLVEGRRVVMMGHPFLQMGPVDLPLAAASVLTLFPSRELSFKVGSAGPVVGRITHDQRAGLAGVLGESAPTVPVTVAVVAPGDQRHTFRFDVALQNELTPTLVFWCLYNALLADGDDRSQQLVHYDLALGLRGRDGRPLPEVVLRGATGGPGGVEALQGEWLAPLQILLGNRHERLTLANVAAELRVERPLRQARIVAVHAPARIAPGETFTVEVELAPRRGPNWRERFELRAPANLQPGFLRLGATSARGFFQLDALRAGGLFEEHSLPATLDLLNTPRSPAELAVALVVADPGFTAGGRELAGLPPSVRHTLASGPPGAARPTMAGYLLRASRPVGHLLQGDAVHDIEVRLPPAPRTEGVRP